MKFRSPSVKTSILDFFLSLAFFFQFSSPQCINNNNNNVSDFCVACSFNFYDSQLSARFYNNSLSLQKNDCLSKTNIFCNRKILIQSENFTETQGVFDAIYGDLLEGFMAEQIILNNCSESNLTILFSKGDHYVLAFSGLSSFFRRLKIHILIKPLFCADNNLTDICVDENVTKVYLRCFCFTIFVAGSLDIQNINFDAIDTNFKSNTKNNNSLCDQERQIMCCDDFALQNVSSPCFINPENIETLGESQTFFELEAIFDDPNFTIPNLKITNVSFSNFFFGYGSNSSIVSFIDVDYFGGNISFYNLMVLNSFFINFIDFNQTNSLEKNIFDFENFYNFQEYFQNNNMSYMSQIYFDSVFIDKFNHLNISSSSQISMCESFFCFQSFQGMFYIKNFTFFNFLPFQQFYILYINTFSSIFVNISKFVVSNSSNLRILIASFGNISIDNLTIYNSTWDDSSLLFQDCDSILLFSFAIINSSFNQENQSKPFIFVDSTQIIIQNSTFNNLNHFSIHMLNSQFVIKDSKIQNLNFQPSDQILIVNSIFTSINSIWSDLSGFVNLFGCVACGDFSLFNTKMNNLIGNFLISGTSTADQLIFSNSSFENISEINYFIDKTLFYGTITIVDCNFSALFVNGAFIYSIMESSLIISSSTFKNVSLITPSAVHFMHIQIGTELIDQCLFSDVKFLYLKNLTTVVSAGNSIMSTEASDLVVKRSSFYNCGFGHIIDIHTLISIEYGDLFFAWTCKNVLFENNSFINEGAVSLFSGFIYCTLVLNNMTLNGNIFRYKDKMPNYHYTGVILNNAPVMIITNNKFHNFQCPSEFSFIHNNGAVSLQGDPTYMYMNTKKLLSLINNSFFECKCQNGGSLGILNYDVINAENIYFFNSSASALGGAMFLAGSSYASFVSFNFEIVSANQAFAFYLRNSIFLYFSNIMVSKGNSNKSGGFQSSNIQKMNFCNILAVLSETVEGGGVFNFKSGEILMQNGIFYSCFGLNGGVLYITENANFTLINTTTHQTEATAGGAIYVESAERLSINNSLFNESYSDMQGAAFFINLIDKLEIKFSTFIGCESLKTGVIYLQNNENEAEYVIDGVSCIGNWAFRGSCIFADALGTLNINAIYCDLNENNLIYLFSLMNLNVTMNNGTILNSKSNYLVYANSVQFNVQNMNFTKNNVSFSIIFFETTRKVEVFNSFFTNNANSFDMSAKSIPIFFCTECLLIVSQVSWRENENIHFIVAGKSNITLTLTSFLSISHSSDNFIDIETGILILTSNYFSKIRGIFISSLDVNVSMENCSFIQNYPDLTGSLSDLYVSSFLAKVFLSISNCSFDLASSLSMKLLYLTNITIVNCVFHGNSMGVGLRIEEIRYLNIRNTKFFNFLSKDDGGGAFSLTGSSLSPVEVFIFNSIFDSNRACFSGAFNIMIDALLNFSLKQSNFTSNQAIYFGDNKCGIGGVAFVASRSPNSVCYLESNVFSNNYADFVAPTLNSLVYLVESDNIFLNNSDRNNFTNKLSSFPLSFSTETTIVASGSTQTLSFILRDTYNQTFFFKSQVTASLIKLSNSSNFIHLKNSDSQPTFTGSFSFQNIIITTAPNTSFQLEIRSSTRDEFGGSIVTFNQTVTLFSRACIRGEILTTAKECRRCQLGTFSLEDPMNISGSHICNPCVDGAFCPGGDYLMPLSGFWRFDSDTISIMPCKSTNVCRGYLLDSELENLFTNYEKYSGDDVLIHGACSWGNSDNLCDSCITGYGKSGLDTVCSKCADILRNVYIKLSLVLFSICLYIILNVMAIYKQTPPYPANVFTSISKIVINHLQKISILSSFKEKLVINDLSTFVSIMNFLCFANEENLSNDCLVGKLFDEYKYFRFFKLYLSLIMPFLVSLLTMFFMLMIQMVYYATKRKSFLTLPQIHLVFLISIFLFYLMITKCSLSILNCIFLDDSNDQYLYSSPNVKCWTGIHFQGFLIIGGVGIVGWGLLFPICLIFLIRKELKIQIFNNRMTTNNTIFTSPTMVSPRILKNRRVDMLFHTNIIPNDKKLNPYLFFYRDYLAKCYYWESILFLYKFFLSLLPNLNTMITDEQTNFLLLGIVLLYTYLLILKKPFKKGFLIYLEFLSNFIVILSRLFAIVMKVYSDSIFAGYFCSISFLVLNITFFLTAGVLFIKFGNLKEFCSKTKATVSLMYSSLTKRSIAIIPEITEQEIKSNNTWRNKESIKRL